jgi:5-methyltetrahydrofolate--homocysteine methyltransferase
MNLIESLLKKGGPVVLDGAWGTELQAKGIPSGINPDTWNLSEPDLVCEVARAYVEAGSQIILTNTFRANRIAFLNHPEAEQVEAINKAGVEISKRAAGDRAYVFASIGPSGKFLVTKQVTKEDLLENFSQQAQAQASAGADGIVIETMGDIEEARMAVQAAKATGLPVVACMVYDSGKNKDRTMMGVTPIQAAEALTEAGADVIGANCGNGIEGYIPICESLSKATKLPIWIKANAGIPDLVGGKVVYRTTPQEFADHIPALLEAGASFVGGCCGTSPDFIRAVCSKLRGK